MLIPDSAGDLDKNHNHLFETRKFSNKPIIEDKPIRWKKLDQRFGADKPSVKPFSPTNYSNLKSFFPRRRVPVISLVKLS